MTIKSHLTYGLLIGAAVSITMPNTIPVKIGLIGVSAISALLPDVDLPTTKVGRKLWIVSNIINKLFGHRGFIHSPFFCIAIAFILKQKCIIPYVWLAFAVGYGSHIFLDLFNGPGIPLLYPLSKKRYHFAKIKTKDKSEYKYCIAISIITVLVYLFVFMNYNNISGIQISFV